MCALPARTDLQRHSQPQIFPQPRQDALTTLRTEFDTEAAVLQYVLLLQDGNPMPSIVRVKEASLPVLNESRICVSMRWVILDWDLPSKGVEWGHPDKPETQERIHAFIKGHPRLKYARAYYFSRSGLRVIFELANPLEISSSTDVLLWKQFYGAFIKLIDVSEIGGDLELKADPFTLNRAPNYRSADGRQIRAEVFTPSTGTKIKVTYPTKEVIERQAQSAAESRSRREYKPLDPQTACQVLWEEPLIKYLRENSVSLHYEDWRALGTNIAALLGDTAGFQIFNDISSWDTRNYNPTAVQTQWPHMVSSAENYGPSTWSRFNMDLSLVYSHVNAKSSLAGQVRRAVENMSSPNATANPLADNSQQVTQMLYTKSVTRGGQTVSVPTKSTSNLLTILTNDNRWAGLIRRNHLGGVDMLGAEPISDEDVTSMRETISRVYGLAFAKDEVWDFVKFISRQNEYHPVFDYLDGLTWDGKDRVAGLAASLGQTDTFAHTVLRKFLISCVVRPLEWSNHTSGVNWKIDTVMILKGSQGKRKSSFFKALCSDAEWFSDSLPSITAERKDASMHMLGKWIVEQAEFEGHVARSSVENMKAFITREREIFRKPYGRAEINMRRPSVLVGTTNSPSFLNDPTGDRRFWVLDIPDNCQIDLAWVNQNRDQIWAQAVDMYRKGMAWWLTDAESKLSNKQNAKFRRPDALHEAVLEFLNSEPTMANIRQHADYEDDLGFTLKQLVTIGLDKKLSDLKSYETQTIVAYLAKMGYVKMRVRINKQRMYIFRKLRGFNDEDAY